VRRISFWVLSTVSAVVLLFGYDASQRGGSVTATTPITSSGSATGSGSTGSGQTSDSRSGNASQSGSGSKSSKTVTGSVAQTQWGPVQVQLVVEGGTITQVKILQYPNGNPRDVEIAQYALPILIKETTAHQSAQIDMVSGATYTSEGYVRSLQSALDQADL
jgi:uncharacterized protein with FMN-binding domain